MLPQAAWRLDPAPPAGRTRCASGSTGSTWTPPPTASCTRPRGGDGGTDPGRGARDRRHPRQDAEPGHRVGRHADRRGRGGRARESPLGLRPGDRVATLVSLTLTPLAITDGLAALGRPVRAGPVRRPRHPVRPLDRRRAPRRPARSPLSLAVMDVCGAPGADRSRVVREHGAAESAGGRHRRGRARAAPCPPPPPGGRREPGHRRRPRRGRGGTAARPALRGVALVDEVVIADARRPGGARGSGRRPPAARPT